MRRALRIVVATALAAGACATPAHAASEDSLAPPDAPPHWLPPADWVYNHWLPYDEGRLYRLLRVDRGRIWRQLRDDRRTIAQLAARRGFPDPARLATRLLAPRRARLSSRRYALLHDRALRTLTQGHLAQHLLFHSLHQFAIPSEAPDIFGVTDAAFRDLRRRELSPLEVGRLHGRSPARIEAMSAAVLGGRIAAGVGSGAMTARQGRILLRRQLSQLPRWLDQARYNGPPKTHLGMLLAKPRDYASNPAISADGARVVYEAYQQRLPKALAAGEISVRSFAVADRTTTLASVPGAGRRTPRSAYNPSVGAGGAVVAFESAEGNQNFAKRYGRIEVLVRDARGGGAPRTVVVPHPAPAAGLSRSTYNPALSVDGDALAFQAARRVGRAAQAGIWVRRLADGATRLVTGAVPGDAYEPSLSGDGSRLAFTAVRRGRASEVWLVDLGGARPVATRVSSGAGFASNPALSADGRHLAFTSSAGRAATRVVQVDLATGARTVVSGAGDGFAFDPAPSGDGSRVAYTSVVGGRPRVLLRDLRGGARTVVAARGASSDPSISADGTRVAFASDAPDLSPAKADDTRGVFVWDAADGATTLASLR